ncbi:hypothetical protein [Streptomyces griseosporeus]|uniref:hypothetical protein n=1 Tax=Streptomyces griseosporeus TaxID=1910 RepID=UPI0036FE397F
MAFPTTPLGLRGELRIGTVWQDITSDLYTRSPITHTRGRPYRSAVADPATCAVTIRNLDGKYTPRNAEGPFYGLIGRNSPFRFSLPGGPARYLSLPGSADRATTPDAAALDITGDLDLRWEGEADWHAKGAVFLLGKWGAPGNRSYSLRLIDGQLLLHIIEDGTTGPSAWSVLPANLPRRAAVRATLDADNGAGGFTVRMYWAPTMAGPWTQYSSDLIGTTPRTIFASTAPLSIAPEQYDTQVRRPVTGKCYRVEVRNGINGTVVAAPDFTARPLGVGGSFTDSAGRGWTLAPDAEISDRVIRFEGEVPEWPPKWTTSERDAWTPIQVAGIMRRLSQGQKPLDSALRRRIPSYKPLAYWPMEEGARATQASSPIEGVRPMRLTRVTWAGADTLPSSSPLPVLASAGGALAMMQGWVPAPATATTAWNVTWLYRLDTPPTTLRTFMRIRSTGTVREWLIQSRDNASRIIGRNDDGANVVDVTIGTSTDLFKRWIKVTFRAQQSGSSVSWRIDWQDVGGDAGGYGSTYTGTVGTVTSLSSPPDGYAADLDGMALGHVSVWPAYNTAAYDRAIDAWAGETAGARMVRLCQEEGVPLAITGTVEDTAPVGAQTPLPLLDLLRECAEADGGLFGETQDQRQLQYRTRMDLYNQTPALTLDYAAGQIAEPFEPVEDDQVRNAWEVQRQGGSSGTAVLAEGALSVLDPPEGIGLYSDSATLNVATDDQTEPMAAWLLHLSTWDEARYPSVTLLLHKCPELIPAVLALREGDKIRIVNLPRRFTGSGTVDLLVDGLKETLLPRAWTVTFTCSPAGPWTVGAIDDPVLGRIDADSSQLAQPATATSTTLTVQTTDGPVWVTDPAEVPFDIAVDGETMTVSAIAPAVADTFTRTVNGGWGSADSGQAWTVTPAADHKVSAGMGIASQPTAFVAHLSLLPSPTADVDLYVDVATSALAAGSSIFTGPVARATDNNNHYQARVEFTTAAGVVLSLRKRVGAVESQLATYTAPLTHTASTWYRVRLQAFGSALKAKVWLSGSREPDNWHVEAADTSLSGANSIGVRSYRNSGNTAAVDARFDAFTVTNPQRFTVARSVNGVTKAQPAGAPVRLASPQIVAL